MTPTLDRLVRLVVATSRRQKALQRPREITLDVVVPEVSLAGVN